MPLTELADAARRAAPRCAPATSAFAKLADELRPRMLRRARVYIGRSTLAEEAVQEAWIVVLKRLERFEGRSSLSTWVLDDLAVQVRHLLASRGRKVEQVPWPGVAAAVALDGRAGR